jgi:hypothetical protein
MILRVIGRRLDGAVTKIHSDLFDKDEGEDDVRAETAVRWHPALEMNEPVK